MELRDERIMTDYEIHEMERTVTGRLPWAFDAINHMSAAQDNWGLIDTVYRELSARLPTDPFPHRRWRE